METQGILHTTTTGSCKAPAAELTSYPRRINTVIRVQDGVAAVGAGELAEPAVGVYARAGPGPPEGWCWGRSGEAWPPARAV